MRRALILLSILSIAALGACGGGGDSGSKTATAKPREVSESDLKDFAQSRDTPMYWAGPRGGAKYELTETKDAVYVRYLVGGAPVGDPKPQYLTVGTYPRGNPFKEIKAAARRRGSKSTPLAGGGLAVTLANAPQSVYFAFPESNVTVEVFHPAPGEAHRLVVSGQIRPVD